MASIVPDDAPKPRSCHILKWPDFNGYGFNLHAEKGKAGQYIGKVDEASPAELAGLKQGDRIVEVNGVNIGNENHKQVVSRIKAGGNETKLLVVDHEADQYYKDKKIVVRGDMLNVIHNATPVPRPTANGSAQEIQAEVNHEVEATQSNDVKEEVAAVAAVTAATAAAEEVKTNGEPQENDTEPEPEPPSEPQSDPEPEPQPEPELEPEPEVEPVSQEPESVSEEPQPVSQETESEPVPEEDDVNSAWPQEEADDHMTDHMVRNIYRIDEEVTNGNDAIPPPQEFTATANSTEQVPEPVVEAVVQAEVQSEPVPEPTPQPEPVVQEAEVAVAAAVVTSAAVSEPAPEPTPEPAPAPTPEPAKPAPTHVPGGLNLTMSLEEARAAVKGRSKKKHEVKSNDLMNMKDKYELFQRL